MSADFEAMVPGLPATEDGVLAGLRADLQAEGSRIANTSPFSAFFRLMGALFARPVLYLRGLILDTVLPGIFTETATGALLDTLAAGMDESRKGATEAKGELTFSREGTSGDLPVPVGTVIESPPIDGVVYRVITSAAGLIPDGSSSALVPVEAEEAGSAWNLGDGYYSILAEVVPGITAVTNGTGWLTEPGRDLESDEELRTRLRLKWKRQSSWHTTDTYRSLISDVTGIDPDDIYFDLAAPRGPGSADAYIVDVSGIPPAEMVQAADDHINLEGNHGLGDDMQVKAIPALPLDLTLTVTATGGATQAEKDQLEADVENLIRAAFRENSAYPEVPRVKPFQRMARSALSGSIHEAFPLVAAVDWISPANDPVPGLELPTINSLTVTVA